MPRSFNWLTLGEGGRRTPRFWLQSALAVLVLLNIAAAVFYVFPPGGTRHELAQQSASLERQIATTRAQTVRLRAVSERVQLGRTEGLAFEWKYFLPKRTAYAAVISEVQRMAAESGLKARDAVFTEEPIEGTSDLDLLNITASYEGPYESLMKFLYATDRAPMLLMLDNLQAAPQQRGGQISTSIRFQAIIQSDATAIGAPRTPGVQQ